MQINEVGESHKDTVLTVLTDPAIVSRINTGTVSKATLKKRVKDGVECIIRGFLKHNDILLTEMNCSLPAAYVRHK